MRGVHVHDVRLSGAFGKFLWLSQHFGENGEKAEARGAEEAGGRGAAGGYPVLADVLVSDVSASGAVFAEAALVHGDLPAPGGAGGAGAIINVTLRRIDLGGAVLGGWVCSNASGTWQGVAPPPSAATCPQLAPA